MKRLLSQSVSQSICLLVPLRALVSPGPLRGQTPQPAVTFQPPSDTVVLQIVPGASPPSADMLDIYCDSTKATKCFTFGPNGVFTFMGNTASYGTANQSAASEITLYGGTPNEAFLQEYSASLSAPTLGTITHNGSGGSIGAGTYYFKITYVNAAGETVASGEQNSGALTGSTNTVTVPAPGASENAFGYQIYEATSSGGEKLIVPTGSNCTLAGSTFGGNHVCVPTSNATWTSFPSPGASPPTANTSGAAFFGSWFISGTAAGIPCFGTAVPGADCTTGNSGNVLAFNPMTAAGDLMYGITANALGVAPANRLAAGSATQVLHSGTVPSWGQVTLTTDVTGTLPVANGGTGVTSAQGNGTLVQLSTGTPTSGDCIKFDANGNTGDYGIPCNLSLSTGGAGGFWGVFVNQPPNATVSGLAAGSNNQVTVYQFVLPWTVSVGHIDYNINTAATGNFDVGIYDSGGSLKLHLGATNTNQTAGNYQGAVSGGAMMLNAGVYFMGWGADNITFKIGVVPINSNLNALLNLGSAKRVGTCANGLSSGALLSTLCSISTSSPSSVPALYFEP